MGYLLLTAGEVMAAWSGVRRGATRWSGLRSGACDHGACYDCRLDNCDHACHRELRAYAVEV